MVMITGRTPLAFVAVSALGLMGIGAFAQVAGEGGPPATAEAKPARIALLIDGTVVKGVVTEEGKNVIVSQPIGSKKFPKERLEKLFDTMDQAYAYKVEQLPAEDFDERIKLARWCLLQKMEPQAREQLDAILAQSPDHKIAKAMIIALDQAQARAKMAKQDPDIKQAGAEQVQAPGDEAEPGHPGSLAPSVIAGARRGLGISDMPVIFDLPQVQAVKVAEVFKRYVHPVLQASCARCHSERYEGSFQLVQMKTRLDRQPEYLRANLDATLKLIDPENPARSELLSSTLRAHGRGPNPRPIFQGSNDTSYRILAAWANMLQAKPPRDGGDAAAPARQQAGPGGDADEAFATQRGRLAAGSASITAPTAKPFLTGPVHVKTTPPARAVPGRGMVVDDSNDPGEFPVPFAVSGVRPQTGAGVPVPAAGAGRPRVGATPATATIPSPAAPDAAAGSPAASGDGVVPASATAPAAGEPGDDAPPVPQPSKKPKQPVKIDPDRLQQLLRLRNQ